MSIAFVASALPARFIRARAEALEVSQVICASKELEDVFRYALPTNSPIEVTSSPRLGGTLISMWYIFQHVRKAKTIIIFHECCWVTLDAILLLMQPRVIFFPHVTLDGFTKVPASQNKRSFSLAKHFGVVQSLLLIFFRPYFDFYDTESDGGSGREAVAALRYEKLRNIQIHNCAETAEILAGASQCLFRDGREGRGERAALIVCAREPLPDCSQFEIYREACDRLVGFGYTIYLKDHPRKAARLNFSYPGAQVISPHVPADLLNLAPSIVIGICSSALAYYGEKAISLAKILPMDKYALEKRIAHLLILPKGGEIKFARNWAEYDNAIAQIPCSLKIDSPI